MALATMLRGRGNRDGYLNVGEPVSNGHGDVWRKTYTRGEGDPVEFYGWVAQHRTVVRDRLFGQSPYQVQRAGERMRTEAARLREFEAAGIEVPRIIAEGPNYLDLERLPMKSIAAVLRNRDVPLEQKKEALRAGARVLRMMHDRGLVHQDADVRNFGVATDNPSHGYVFDFEQRYTGSDKVRHDIGYFTATAVLETSQKGIVGEIVESIEAGYGKPIASDLMLRASWAERFLRKPRKWSDFRKYNALRHEASQRTAVQTPVAAPSAQ